MKINSGTSVVTGLIKTNISEGTSFEKSQVITGKILSANGSELDIVLSQGFHTKAVIQGSANLPLNVDIAFEVLENTSEMLLLCPVTINQDTTAPKDRMLNGLAAELGIKPNFDNISFLSNYKNTLSKSIGQLLNILRENGDMSAVRGLQEIFIKPEKLIEYLKGFNEKSIEHLISQLNEISEEISKESASAKFYTKILGDIAKILLVQVNHQLPLFFIPVPLVFDSRFYPGEIWIDRDADNSGQEQGRMSIHIFIDTPRFGRIEADISGTDKAISLDLYFNRDVLPLFTGNLSILRQQLSGLSIDVNSINFHELKQPRSFVDLAQKYIHPFPSIDLKV